MRASSRAELVVAPARVAGASTPAPSQVVCDLDVDRGWLLTSDERVICVLLVILEIQYKWIKKCYVDVTILRLTAMESY